MWRKERRIATLFVLIACLVGSSRAVERHIDQESLIEIEGYLEHVYSPDKMLDVIKSRREEMGDLDDARGDYRRANMIVALDSLLELRQFATDGCCDDEAGDLIGATLEATRWKHSRQMSKPAIDRIHELIYFWAGMLVDKCHAGVYERLLEARSALHSYTVQEIEGFLNDGYLDQLQSDFRTDLRNINWIDVVDQLIARQQTPMTFSEICKDYIRVMRNQAALARLTLLWKPANLRRPLYIKRTLMRISFCNHLAEPIMSTGLYEAMRNRNLI